MKSSDIKKVPKLTVILYICAILMALSTIFIIYKSNVYISDLVKEGFDPKKELVEVINYYLVTVTPFVFYTISLITLGYIVKKIYYITEVKEEIKEKSVYLERAPENKDDEIDEFFSNI
ncbi:hypothetical protein [Paraclostridium bifermentans]|uniref:hypothetical protein n=1 Tax=Paraclostridium bifermentans TaxID=1490 RepID=UPI001C804C33|nr:hypothetical protein [Paraclostridium bifermentans]GIM31553.1 hypothetical protein PAGU1678_08230 [Paraclostridium bifermentans subsp. muricolitidis]